MNAKRTLIVVAILAVGAITAAIALTKRPSDNGNPVRPSTTTGARLPELPAAHALTYREALAAVAAQRETLASRYQAATTAGAKSEVIDQAAVALAHCITAEIIPHWYGTEWDFSGTTVTPREGKIACGYFVSTVLRDAGVKVQRVKLAQQASENIILSLTDRSHIQRFSNAALGDFVAAVRKSGPGLYVVGLDSHTGFIIHSGDEVHFVHSSYVEPKVVIQERAMESKVLGASKYRVIGKISASEALI